jgi:hypothetical protein
LVAWFVPKVVPLCPLVDWVSIRLFRYAVWLTAMPIRLFRYAVWLTAMSISLFRYAVWLTGLSISRMKHEHYKLHNRVT